MNLCNAQSKMQIHLKFILLTYFALILSTVFGKHSWFSLKKSGRVYGTTLKLVSPSTLVSCFNICVKDLKCKVISFNRSSKICETLTESVLHGDIRSDMGWETYGNYLHDSELVNIEISRYFKKQPFSHRRCSLEKAILRDFAKFTFFTEHPRETASVQWETYRNHLYDSELVNIEISRYFDNLFFIIIISQSNFVVSLAE